MRRRALSSGLLARDQVACVTQASAKGREAQHDEPTLRHSTPEVKCDISLAACRRDVEQRREIRSAF
jgi:hypothetical protein